MAEAKAKRYTKRVQPHPCEHCGTETKRPRFCSVRCSWIARDRRNGVLPKKIAPTRICVVCSTVFVRSNRITRDVGLCCSRECGFMLIRWRGEQSRQVRAAKAEFARWAKRAKAKPKAIPIGNVCAMCNVPVDKWQHRCDPCRLAHRLVATAKAKASEAYKAARRAAKARRRAVERGAHAERFDPLEILTRDGWRCHICGAATPKRLRGSFDDRAPELDHIVPLAAGGQHTRLNTACACRRCNREKGGEVRGQLRLVA